MRRGQDSTTDTLTLGSDPWTVRMYASPGGSEGDTAWLVRRGGARSGGRSAELRCKPDRSGATDSVPLYSAG
jgi:hypothetical protein